MADEVSLLKKIPEIIGWMTPLIVGVTVWLTGRKKNDIDESTLVLNQWKALLEAHKVQMADQAALFEKKLNDQADTFKSKMADAKEEIEQLRHKLGMHEERIEALEAENRALRTENEGYRRNAIQRSQSEMQLLPPASTNRSPTATAKFKDPDEDLIGTLDNGPE